MFELYGLISPGKEDTLKTNGGLMYYHYDGIRNVTELTDRHGEKIEHYRYDAFGNMFSKGVYITQQALQDRNMIKKQD